MNPSQSSISSLYKGRTFLLSLFKKLILWDNYIRQKKCLPILCYAIYKTKTCVKIIRFMNDNFFGSNLIC